MSRRRKPAPVEPTFKAACSSLWGPQYRSEGARQLSIGLRSMMRYDTGERDIPQTVWEALAELLIERRKKIDQVLAKLPVS